MAILPLNYILLIVIPIIAVCILFIVFFIMLVLRQSKSTKPRSVISATSSITKTGTVDSNQFSDPQHISYSPDVRNCMYGGKLGRAVMKDRKKGGQVFTYKELELATEGFSERNVLGNGGFGVVYRGTLSDGTVTAIKVLHREGKQGEKEFRMEAILIFYLILQFVRSLIAYIYMYSGISDY